MLQKHEGYMGFCGQCTCHSNCDKL